MYLKVIDAHFICSFLVRFMRQLFFFYFGLRRRCRQWRRTKFIRPMRTYEEAMKVRFIMNAFFFMAGWSLLGWTVFPTLIIVDEKTGKEKVSFVSHFKEQQAHTMSIIEYITGKELVPRRPPVEITKTEFPADEFN